jgi:hypothetical protein
MSSFKKLVIFAISLILIICLGIYLCWDVSILTMCLTPYSIGIFWTCEDLYDLPKSERWKW